jgi:thiol:disulfide interchange protein DsbD
MPPLVNFGYEHEVYLPFDLKIPADAPAGLTTLAMRFHWLVCRENCIPGQARFTRQLKVVDQGPVAATPEAKYLATTREQLPVAHNDWQVATDPWEDGAGEVWQVDVALPISWGQVTAFDFFPWADTGVSHQGFRFHRDGAEQRLRMVLPKGEVPPQQAFAGVLVAEGDAARQLAQPALVLAGNAGAATGDGETGTSFWVMLGLAVIGGLILNVMPCVLPVLSLKVIQLVQKGDRRQRPALGALCYAAGVELTFLLLAVGLLAFKAAGQSVGWGFQLQSPYFVFALIVIFFVLALNFLGLVQPWDALTRFGRANPSAGYYSSQLSTGILAVVVASPCTAPLMGVAIGYALSQSAMVCLTLFAGLGLGFSAPFLLLGIFPRLLQWLPKPGTWMETLRQFMAFPLLATVLWLLWVLFQQTGFWSVLLSLGACWLIGLVVWWQLRLQPRGRGLKALMWGVLVAILIYTGLQLPTEPAAGPQTQAAARSGVVDDQWQPFSPTKLAELREQGPVFIDFTAAWCVTCQVNKRLVLNRSDILALFAEHQFQLLRADWTDYDPAIGRILESYGRSGVPVYVIYRPGQDQPTILPEILTPEMVKAYIRR